MIRTPRFQSCGRRQIAVVLCISRTVLLSLNIKSKTDNEDIFRTKDVGVGSRTKSSSLPFCWLGPQLLEDQQRANKASLNKELLCGGHCPFPGRHKHPSPLTSQPRPQGKDSIFVLKMFKTCFPSPKGLQGHIIPGKHIQEQQYQIRIPTTEAKNRTKEADTSRDLRVEHDSRVNPGALSGESIKNNRWTSRKSRATAAIPYQRKTAKVTGIHVVVLVAYSAVANRSPLEATVSTANLISGSCKALIPKTNAAYPRMPRLPQKPQDQYPATLRIASHPHGESRQWQQQRGANEKPNHYVLHESSRPTRRKAVRRLPGLRDTRLEEAAVPGDISPLPENDTTIGNPSTVTPPTTPIRRNRRAPRATEGLEANQPWQGWG